MPRFHAANQFLPTEKKAMETAVPVIASYNTQGSIMPLYVRVHGIAYPIRSCWCQPVNAMSDDCYAIYRYHCTAIMQEYLKDFTLTYHTYTHVWTLELQG